MMHQCDSVTQKLKCVCFVYWLTVVQKCDSGWGNEQFEVEAILDYTKTEVIFTSHTFHYKNQLLNDHPYSPAPLFGS